MKFFWKKQTDNENLRMEALLQETLTPVEPRTEFLADLRQNLIDRFPRRSAVTVAEPEQPGKLQTAVLVTSGILGSVLLVMSGIRGIISLVAAILLFVSWLRQNTGQRSPTAI
jgi:hypothetical protein